MSLNKAKRNELEAEIAQHNYLDMAYAKKAHIEKKNKFRNLQRFMHVCRTEHEEEKEIFEEEEKVARKKAELDEDEKLAIEVDKVKRKEVNEARLRQQLRENEPELRELESKLRMAYVSKELAAQLAERKAARLQKKIKEKEEYEILIQSRCREEEIRKRQIEEEMRQKTEYRHELQDQMILKEKTKRYLYEEFLREKKMIDDIVQRIYEEDERDAEEKLCKMKKTREEMVAFKQAQQVWRDRKRKELEEENIRIQVYLQDKAREIQARVAAKKQVSEAKEQVIANIAKKMIEKEQETRKREEILQELLEEEQKEALNRRHREEIEKQLRQRLEVREALSRQMAERQERLKQEAAQDAAYKNQLMAKLAEDQKLDQLTAEKKRLKTLQLRRDVEQMMKDRRQRRGEEMHLLTKLYEQAEKEEQQRRQMIEEERIRMLKEHAKNLFGYLPKGVIKVDDLPHLGSDVMEEYLKHYGNKIFQTS